MRKVELVVIGTSLGGRKALETLLPALPVDFPRPIAIVQHRAVDLAEDGLASYLVQRSLLPLVDGQDKDAILDGRVTLAPGGYHLLVEQGHFALSIDAPVCQSRPSIDVLFESAADVYGAGVVAVLLTGANEDGAAGVAHVKSKGGVVIVQDPDLAECPVMPRAALANTTPDYVLPIDQIGPLLLRLAAEERPT